MAKSFMENKKALLCSTEGLCKNGKLNYRQSNSLPQAIGLQQQQKKIFVIRFFIVYF
jgi:hypothetical protein